MLLRFKNFFADQENQPMLCQPKNNITIHLQAETNEDVFYKPYYSTSNEQIKLSKENKPTSDFTPRDSHPPPKTTSHLYSPFSLHTSQFCLKFLEQHSFTASLPAIRLLTIESIQIKSSNLFSPHFSIFSIANSKALRKPTSPSLYHTSCLSFPQ